MSVFEARLTAAEFLGDVRVIPADSGLVIRGDRAPHWLAETRTIGQWSLAAAGVVGLVAGFEYALALLVFAPIFSLLAYMAMWWSSSEAEVTVTPSFRTEAAVGPYFRWYDVIWLGNLVTAIGLLVNTAHTGKRTVSFRGPSPVPNARNVRYVLHAKSPGDAAALAAALLGPHAGTLEAPPLEQAPQPDAPETGAQ